MFEYFGILWNILPFLLYMFNPLCHVVLRACCACCDETINLQNALNAKSETGMSQCKIYINKLFIPYTTLIYQKNKKYPHTHPGPWTTLALV
jgi:hypothetical protein